MPSPNFEAETIGPTRSAPAAGSQQPIAHLGIAGVVRRIPETAAKRPTSDSEGVPCAIRSGAPCDVPAG